MTDLFRSEPLNVVTHEDPSKHYIGESLTPPTVSDIATSGVATTTGDSPFAARSDHTHDNRFRYTILNQLSGKVCVGGGVKTYIDGMGYFAGVNMFAPGSSQLVVPGVDGLWMLNCRFQVNRSSGVFPAATAYTIRFEYNNATAVRDIEVSIAPEGRGFFVYSVSDFVALTALGNVQFSYLNFDSVSHTVTFTNFGIIRLASNTSG